MIDPAPPPRCPKAPSGPRPDYIETIRQLQATIDSTQPTPLMGALLVFSAALFLGLVCFVAYNDFERTHSGDVAPERR